jgi:cell division septal protein FtsQ
VALVAAGAWAGRRYVLTSPRFRLRAFSFSPTRHAQEADLRRAVDRYRARNLFALDLDRIERDLQDRPWVKTARARRVLPDQVFCAIEEREPRGAALIKGRVWLVDEDGTPIDTYSAATRAWSFPIFTGVDEAGGARAKAQVGRGLALLAFLADTHPGLDKEISEIDLSRDDRVGLHMNDGGPLVRLHPTEFATNLDRYLGLRDYLATHFGDGAYVDLRFKDRISFLPQLAKGQ